VGGIAGWSRGSISQVYTTGNITGDTAISSYYLYETGHYVGGIAGYSDQGTSISHAYTTGNIKGASRVGGIAGAHSSGSSISNTYSTSTVDAGGDYAGGIAGHNLGGIQNSVALNPAVTGSVGSVGRVTVGSSISGNVRARDDMHLSGYQANEPLPQNTDARHGNSISTSELGSHFWSSSVQFIGNNNIWDINGEQLPTLKNVPNRDQNHKLPNIPIDGLFEGVAFVFAFDFVLFDHLEEEEDYSDEDAGNEDADDGEEHEDYDDDEDEDKTYDDDSDSTHDDDQDDTENSDGDDDGASPGSTPDDNQDPDDTDTENSGGDDDSANLGDTPGDNQNPGDTNTGSGSDLGEPDSEPGYTSDQSEPPLDGDTTGDSNITDPEGGTGDNGITDPDYKEDEEEPPEVIAEPPVE
jgi:hypothetical protein